MQHFHDTVLYKTHEHFLVVVIKTFFAIIPLSIVYLILWFFLLDYRVYLTVLFFIVAVIFFAWYYFFWVKSYFIISNEKIVVKVRNGIFSKFHMNIYFKNIRDAAFSKNHMLHYVFDYGTLFARSSAGAVWDLEAKNIPNIERVYKIVNYLYNLSEQERKTLTNLDAIIHLKSVDVSSPWVEELKWGEKKETLKEAIEKEKNILLKIQWLKEVVVLSDSDRRYIFEHEEDRNHGVYECLRRQVVFAATHDSTFREPDEAIVMQAWEKVVFPVIEFHEIKRKKVSSSSPWLLIHEYLTAKFENCGDYDATLLIWFDI